MRKCQRLTAVFAVVAMLGTVDLAHGDVLIKVNKATQRMTVSVDGAELYRWPVSTARHGYTTPDGAYHPIRIERKWFSRKYDNAPMPHAIFFKGGYAIHGSYEISKIGKPVSHGCVRLYPANAKTLFKLVKDASIYNTQVVIEGPDASASPTDVRLAHSASAPHTSNKSRRRSPQLTSAMRSHLRRHVEQTADGSNEGVEPPQSVNPFAALFSGFRNHEGSHETRVANERRAGPEARSDAHNARTVGRYVDRGRTHRARFVGSHVGGARSGRRFHARYSGNFYRYARYYYHYRGRGLFAN